MGYAGGRDRVQPKISNFTSVIIIIMIVIIIIIIII